MGSWTQKSTGLNKITQWWKIGSIAPSEIVAVYQPLGAATLGTSLSNIVNPGTFDAAAGVAPSFDQTIGWTFDGATTFLTTGITPTSDYTIVARIQAKDTTAGTVMGSRSANADFSLEIAANPLGPTFSPRWAADNNTSTAISGVTTTDFMYALASNQAYQQESGEGITSIAAMAGPFSGTPNTLYIGAYNAGPAATSFLNANASIQAIAVYNRQLTFGEISAVFAAGFTAGATALNVNWILINPATRHLDNSAHELWAATDAGIFRTVDGGGEWGEITLPDPANTFSDSPAATVGELTFHWIDYDPTSELTLYVMGVKASVSRVWIYKSTDLGETWSSRGVKTA